MAKDTSKTQDHVDKASEMKGVAGTAGGGTAGALAGAGIGAVAGGPVGAAVGAAIGAVAGAAGGAAIDYESHKDDFYSDWDAQGYRETTSWKQAEPAYRYGWESYDSGSQADWDSARSSLSKKWSGKGDWATYEPMVQRGWLARAQAQVDRGAEAVVPIVEEEVEVGKRKVKKGGVKVETSVIETPVEETVHLHDEKVKVHRRAANRPVEAGDLAAFEEGTIEVEETAEEAVVSKKARVVEEVVIKKEGQDRAQTIRETARRTDVDVHSTGETEVVDETNKTRKKK